MFPRCYLIQRNGSVGIECRINLQIAENFQPGVIQEMIVPSVKITSAVISLQQHLAQTTITLGEHCFQKTCPAVVITDTDFSTAYTTKQILLFFPKCLLCVLRYKLKRRMRLRDKTGNADGNLYPFSFRMFLAVIEVDNFLCGFRNACDILHGFCGKPHHEIRCV